MSRVLPSSPNLEHLRKEAKSLLRDASRGDAAALQAIPPVGQFPLRRPPHSPTPNGTVGEKKIWIRGGVR